MFNLISKTRHREKIQIGLIATMLLLFNLPYSWGQTPGCDTVDIKMGETFTLKVSPDTFFVRVKDKNGQYLKTKKTPCLFFKKSGYYRVHTGIDYSEGQLNESFFLTILNASPGHENVSMCDANAGPYKVVPDIPNVLKNIDIETDTTVNAGLFYFEAGFDTIQVNHYYLIQEHYPQFLNPPGVLMKEDDIESVHFSKFELTYIAPDIEHHDLLLTKRASVDTITIGKPFSYNLTVDNLGPGKGREIWLSDKIPNEITIETNSFNFQPDSTVAKTAFTEYFWKVDSLDGNFDYTVRFNAHIPEPDSSIITPFDMINTASVASLCDTNYTNNFDTTTVVVVAPMQLTDISVSQVVKTDSFIVQNSDTLWFVKAGKSYSYFITVRNEADVLGQNVILETILPDSVTAEGIDAEDTLRWHLGELPAFADTTIALQVTLAPKMPEGTNELVNTAQVHSDNENPEKLDNNLAVNRIFNYVPPPPKFTDLTLSQTVRTDSFTVDNADTIWFVREGETYSYFLKISNLADVAAQNIVIRNILPDSVRSVNFPEADTLQWKLAALQPFADTTLVLTVALAAHMPTGLNELINTALVSAQNEDSQKLDNNSSTVSVFNFVPPKIELTDLAITQRVSTDSFAVMGTDTLHFADAGEVIHYTIRIFNQSNITAQNVTVTDVPPDSITIPDFAGQDTLRWHLGKLPGSADTLLTFAATVSNAMPVGRNELINTVRVRADNEDPQKLADNISVLTVLNVVEEPQILPDLSIVQSVQADSFAVQGADTVWFVKPGGRISYSIKIKNEENIDAKNVVVRDILPDSVSVGNIQGGDTIEWQLGNFSAFEERSIKFQAWLSHAIDTQAIQLVNTAVVEAENEDPEKLANNISVSTETFFLIRQPDFSEGCTFFTLDRNLYQPDKDAGLGINFQLRTPSQITLDVYDMSGYHIRKIVDEKFNSGLNQINWDGLTENRQKVGSGVYVITLRSENFICWKKVLIAR